MSRITTFIIGLDKRIQLAIAYAVFIVAVAAFLALARLVVFPLRDSLAPAVQGWAPDEQRFILLVAVNFVIGALILVGLALLRRISWARSYWQWFYSLSEDIHYGRREQ